MGKTVEYADGTPVKMKKKSKKNKNKTDDLLPFDDDNRLVETDGDHLKKKKKDKHREKKRKSESKEDGDEDQHDKEPLAMGKTVEYADGTPVKMKKKSKKNKNKTFDLLPPDDDNRLVETDGDHLKKKKKEKHREKKRKSESKEDGDEDQHDKVNLVNDDLQKKNKKRKRCSSEETSVKEIELDQNAGPDIEKDCTEDVFKKIDKKKKKEKKKKNKKIDGQNLDTEKTKESTLNTRNLEDKSMEETKSQSQRFSGHVEVFPTSGSESEKQATKGDSLVRGKRFTPEEDEIVKQAVLDYITTKGLGEEGLKMVLNCKSHKGMRKCWQEIGLCLPQRPYLSVYYRAHILFERGKTRSWTPEEIETLRELHEKYGNDWKKIADELGKHRFHVKDTWRRIKLDNKKKGRWNQEEYQNLYDLVNLDIQLKVSGEAKKISKHGMLRDNIPWTAISEKLSTRADAACCVKWYNQLTSSLVAENKWSDADDYRMIGALYEIDAACAEDVDWDNVLEHRPGDICLKRWNQMVKHIGNYGSKPFSEQVDILAKRYCPDLAETRDAWDNKPVVP
ncbi:hypothetical protein SSX86_029276 [Deinandra increscens subsp. villosa]|uniref:Uncharacterized protein n=1 Tax=Deinandra increscens subsp. villosa TaxID=3103831 RepID=A0AAP0C9R7_9ASTR